MTTASPAPLVAVRNACRMPCYICGNRVFVYATTRVDGQRRAFCRNHLVEGANGTPTQLPDFYLPAIERLDAHQRALSGPVKTTAELALEELEKPVSAVYSGAHGCACGCRGTHSSTRRSIALVTGKIRRELAALDHSRSWAEDAVAVEPGSYVSVQTPTRLYIAYTDGRVS